ncbi:EscS/YscS/HrcS family type III secretion system export apparatus protein [Tabrizicola aquatica]|uniref:EscS/YscS/HrcS family type III secretion system export apparatus protein n=1 Tax=Tabrizicola aquatica TaxID=909926 RepID=UPI000CD1669C|nr:flagellar biosynthetic protein FliQ [Tabrizicola aquatica]
MIHILEQFVVAVALLAGVPLAIAAGLGVAVSLFQALTQVQDQTLPQLIKVAAIALSMVIGGALLAAPLLARSAEVFDTFWYDG